jgi:hypothetical protein
MEKLVQCGIATLVIGLLLLWVMAAIIALLYQPVDKLPKPLQTYRI